MATGATAADLSQSGARIRVGWGLYGLRALAAGVDVAVIVDVLSFTTSVAVAREAGAEVVPWDPATPVPTAAEAGVDVVAGPRAADGPSLSPASLTSLAAGTRLLLPSPNGSRLLAWAQREGVPAHTACLRDRQVVAQALADAGAIAVIAAGERWPGGDRARFALEDWLGAGSVVAALTGSRSPEAVAAEAAFDAHRGDLQGALRATASGRELDARGFAHDVVLAAELDATGRV
ncbi:MAG: 2-phosphosulfolactate phosphatase [Myxococcales bacterium]|nr:2-phosphosulfolactate phosphatase [Myxococcales bacterium]